jgi:2-succinyl-5-enolpyruvyl-6-hydroxy-3-cyclohexene-1-carboxylate synthase
MTGPPRNAGEALATVLVDELARCGLAHACVAPGSRSTPLALALAGHPAVAVEVIVDERSAAFCALGIGKATGVPAAVVCTSGTAAANLYPAVVEAAQSRTPLLVLTADRPPELRDAGANQTIDQVKLYGSAVRWFSEVGVPEARAGSVRYWRSAVCRAWTAATGSPAGPVHLNLAFRDPLVPVPDGGGFAYPLDGRPGAAPWTRVVDATAVPAAGVLARLAGEVAAARRGLIVAGQGPARAQAGGGLAGVATLAAAAGWPILADPLSGLRCGDLAVSTYQALLAHPPLAEAFRPDLVMRVGNLGTSKALAAFLPPDVRQIVVDADGAWIDPERSAAELLRADPGATAAALAGLLGAGGAAAPDSGWLEGWRRAEAVARRAIDAVLDAEEAPSEPRAARDLAGAWPAGGTLVAGSSMPVRDLEWFMRPRAGLRVLANRGASGIDGFVSTVLGAAIAGGGPVAALAGDLSMLHDRNGLQLARSGGLDAVFVVVNNNGGGIFSFLPQAEHPEHFERLFGTPQELSFRSMAGAAGCGYAEVASADGLVPAVEAARAAGGVHLVEVRTDREANVALHRTIWRAVGEALDAEGCPR